MKIVSTIGLSLILGAAFAFSAEPAVVLQETFDQPLSADWHWGLGTWTTKHPVVAEPKANIGFGGESGGPEGEKAGALESRHLTITATPTPRYRNHSNLFMKAPWITALRLAPLAALLSSARSEEVWHSEWVLREYL